jgi:hypothetical protein
MLSIMKNISYIGLKAKKLRIVCFVLEVLFQGKVGKLLMNYFEMYFKTYQIKLSRLKLS